MPYKNADQGRESARLRQARYREKHRDRIRIPSEKERQSARDATKRWRRNNLEKHRTYSKQYNLDHRTPCAVCGQPKKRTARVCGRCHRGQYSGAWKGGAFVTSSGYRLIVAPPNHPGAHKNGYINEHRLVMERIIGRFLFPDETVHHKNGVRHDNRQENLELWCSRHPQGQRVIDLVKWAKVILDRYNGLSDGKIGDA